ncbi:MAG: DNA helicase II [Pseudomonadota bacterium]|nr:DNA helicase II [Pseudomonadota bacterium]
MTSESSFLQGARLNPEQESAVTSGARFLRVLAGAGSGKTRVLVHRAAFLIKECGISPYEILAVTFTNKAANEMRNRIADLCDAPVKGMWVGTFHGLAHRFLRIHFRDAGLDEQFQIMDTDDQLRMLKRIHKEMQIQDADFTPKQSMGFINREKDEGRYPASGTGMDRQTRLMQEVYQRYQDLCDQSSLVDFAELLLRSLKLFENNPAIADFYQRKFAHILVDEFQDTNAIQFKWLQALLGHDNALTIVGDDDQSIYGWRGAQIENILRFSEKYPETETVRLEQNYRSTKSIIGAANGVISCNIDRLGKALWTAGEQGEPVQLYAAYNEIDESKFIVERIAHFKSKGIPYRKQAILYRSNAQSRVMEEALLHARVPYRIYGGQRFFDRAEIKSAMAYLRLIALPEDDAAFERVINFPARGLGDRSVQTIRDAANAQQISMWQAASRLIEHKALSARAHNSLVQFIELIKGLQTTGQGITLSELVSAMLSRTQLVQAYAKESQEQRQAREENLKELVSAASSFNSITDFEQEDFLDPSMRDMAEDDGFLPIRPKVVEPSNDAKVPAALAAFLDHVSLESGEMQASQDSDAVQMMTIHASKGLEFPVVFLAGLEEGLFPSQMSMNETGRIEEERRLCYVGITRAEQYLTISYAESRRIYGEERRTRISRFVREIPSEFLKEIRLGSVVKPVYHARQQESSLPSGQPASAPNDGSVKVGDRVMHRAFGEGIVLATEGRDARMRVQVNFTRAGSKWLMANVAKLEVLS